MNRRNGFSILEVLIATMISFMVVASAYQLLMSQTRLLATQTAVIDTRDTNRRVAVMLSSDLRNASAVGGDLYTITEDSVVLRSYRTTGTACSGTIPFSSSRYLGLRNVVGEFQADSARVYSLTNNRWYTFNVTEVWNGSDAWTSGQSSVCFWADSTVSSPRPQVAIKLTGPVDSLLAVGVGANVRVFQRIKYGLYPRNNRWWMGRQVGGGAWEHLTGPLLSPNNGGLKFTYYDANDVVTTDPALVSYVEFILQSESAGKISGRGTLTDSLSMTIYLRNN